MTTKGKVITTIGIVAAVVVAILIYFNFFFVYSTGVDAGTLNYFQKEGIIFKTYEGKIIQTGFKSSNTKAVNNTSIKSNEITFSVTDEAVAQKLMRCSGKRVELEMKRYLGTLPWRGKSQYIAKDVLSIRD